MCWGVNSLTVVKQESGRAIVKKQAVEMNMRAYPDLPINLKNLSAQNIPDINCVQATYTDETLKEYVPLYIKHYRETIERYFPKIAPFLDFYTDYPFDTLILRLGGFGVITGFRPGTSATVTILQPTDFDPPLESFNIMDIQERWKANGICAFR